ncbi:MAG: substrate-binding domain-containing protein [Thermodesulfobacteriota bacterium]
MSGEMMNTKEVAQYLGIHEKQVYALIKSKKIPSTRVTGKWVFPKKLIDEWIESNVRKGLGQAREKSKRIEGALLASGSNDPTLDFLQADLRRNFPDLYLFSTNIGSTDGLRALNMGYTDIAWSHLFDPKSGEYNIPFLPLYLPNMKPVVVNLFYRDLGFVIGHGNPLRIKGFQDLTKKGVRFVNRQKGSGTRLLIDQKLKELGIPSLKIEGYKNEVNTHFEVGFSILGKVTNVGVATMAVSKLLGLDFIPITKERFDMVLSPQTFFNKGVQALIGLLQTEVFRQKVEKIGGYDLRDAGRVIYSSEGGF